MRLFTYMLYFTLLSTNGCLADVLEQESVIQSDDTFITKDGWSGASATEACIVDVINVYLPDGTMFSIEYTIPGCIIDPFDKRDDYHNIESFDEEFTNPAYGEIL